MHGSDGETHTSHPQRLDGAEEAPRTRPTSTNGATAREPNAVLRAVDAVRSRIHTGQLLPGEHIRQEEMAELLRMSRVPIREALKVLATEGAVLHRPNQGYFVAKMGEHEVTQIYLMRRLLETELLRSVEWPDEATLDTLRATNDQIRTASAAGDSSSTISLNHDFHLTIFRLSPLQLIEREVSRLWRLSDSYRALYHYDPSARDRITGEHDLIVKALAEHDVDALVFWSDKHRGAAGEYVRSMLRGVSSPGRPG